MQFVLFFFLHFSCFEGFDGGRERGEWKERVKKREGKGRRQRDKMEESYGVRYCIFHLRDSPLWIYSESYYF